MGVRGGYPDQSHAHRAGTQQLAVQVTGGRCPLKEAAHESLDVWQCCRHRNVSLYGVRYGGVTGRGRRASHLSQLRRQRVRTYVAVHHRPDRRSWRSRRPRSRTSSWLTQAREGLREPGQYVAYRTGDELVTYSLQREWTRIGRSLSADIRFDDPTVSRRHALIVRQPDGMRVLDDRSLNGVFVNGERVEWSTLADGDEVVIGRHHLHFVDIPVVSGMRYQQRGRAGDRRTRRCRVSRRPRGPILGRTWRRRSRSCPRRAAPVRRRPSGR